MERNRVALIDADGIQTEHDGQSDLHSKECRLALTQMVMRLFVLWKIPSADQATLLNRSLGTIRRYRSGGCFRIDEEMYDRVGSLLVIHKNLRILYPYNLDLAYRWVSARNQAFDGQPPIKIMKQGLYGLKRVWRYLEYLLQY